MFKLNICMFYLPIHSMLVVKFVVGLGKRVFTLYILFVFKGEDRGIRVRLGA